MIGREEEAMTIQPAQWRKPSDAFHPTAGLWEVEYPVDQRHVLPADKIEWHRVERYRRCGL